MFLFGPWLLQEALINEDTNGESVELLEFSGHHTDHPVSQRKRGDSVIAYVDSHWRPHLEFRSKYSNIHVSSSIVECKPKHLSNFRSILLATIYISPLCPHDSYQDFLDTTLTILVNYVDTSLCIVASDFTLSNVICFISFGLINAVNFSTRMNTILGISLVKCFPDSCQFPIGISDHLTHCHDHETRGTDWFANHNDVERDGGTDRLFLFIDIEFSAA